jgi:hypothetical protein
VTAEQFMARMPAWVPPPLVVIEASDCIDLDWDVSPRRVLTVTLYADGTYGYSALLDHVATWDSGIDDGDVGIVVTLLGQLFPQMVPAPELCGDARAKRAGGGE